MAHNTSPQEQRQSKKDRLVTRPDEPLPSVEDPQKPRGEPADPKTAPPQGQGTDPKATEIDYTA